MFSHELRNPLGAVTNATAILSSDSVNHEERDRALGVVKRQLQQMSRLMDDLLDVSRITHGKIELRRTDLDLRETVEQALAAAERLFGDSRLNLATQISDEPVWVNGDPARLEQVTVNLLTNAIKYTPPGGDVTLSLRAEDEAFAVVDVVDTGAGIPQNKLDEIVSLFYQSGPTLDSIKLVALTGYEDMGKTLIVRRCAIRVSICTSSSRSIRASLIRSFTDCRRYNRHATDRTGGSASAILPPLANQRRRWN